MSDILLVEDDTDFAAFVQLALSRAGHHVTWARDGGEASALLKTRNWKLVITDVFMPIGDGFDVLRAVEAHCPQASVITMSGGSADQARYLSALNKLHTIDATLYKPFPRDLISEVERLLAPVACALAA